MGSVPQRRGSLAFARVPGSFAFTAPNRCPRLAPPLASPRRCLIAPLPLCFLSFPPRLWMVPPRTVLLDSRPPKATGRTAPPPPAPRSLHPFRNLSRPQPPAPPPPVGCVVAVPAPVNLLNKRIMRYILLLFKISLTTRRLLACKALDSLRGGGSHKLSSFSKDLRTRNNHGHMTAVRSPSAGGQIVGSPTSHRVIVRGVPLGGTPTLSPTSALLPAPRAAVVCPP